jgi:hypothetical protein
MILTQDEKSQPTQSLLLSTLTIHAQNDFLAQYLRIFTKSIVVNKMKATFVLKNSKT